LEETIALDNKKVIEKNSLVLKSEEDIEKYEHQVTTFSTTLENEQKEYTQIMNSLREKTEEFQEELEKKTTRINAKKKRIE